MLLIRRFYASVLLLTGLVLAGAGGYLLSLGGSPYYALAGLSLLVSGVMIWRGDARGAWLYGALLAATVAWALWEAGLAGWPLLARLGSPVILGLPLLARGVRGADHAPAKSSGWHAFAGALLVAAAVGVGLHALGPKDFDPLYPQGVLILVPRPPQAQPRATPHPMTGATTARTLQDAISRPVQINARNAGDLTGSSPTSSMRG